MKAQVWVNHCQGTHFGRLMSYVLVCTNFRAVQWTYCGILITYCSGILVFVVFLAVILLARCQFAVDSHGLLLFVPTGMTSSH